MQPIFILHKHFIDIKKSFTIGFERAAEWIFIEMKTLLSPLIRVFIWERGGVINCLIYGNMNLSGLNSYMHLVV